MPKTPIVACVFTVALLASACAGPPSQLPLHTLAASDFAPPSIDPLYYPMKRLPEQQALRMSGRLMCIRAFEARFGTNWTPTRLRAITDASTSQNERLFASFLEVLALHGQESHLEVLSRVDRLRTQHGLGYKYERWTNLDEKTYYSNQSLRNILGVLEHSSRLHLATSLEEDAAVALSYFKHRDALFTPSRELVRQFEDLGLPTEDLAIEHRILSRLSRISVDNYLDLNEREVVVRAIWENDGDRFITLQDGENRYTIKVDPANEVVLVPGSEAVSSFEEYIADIDLRALGLGGLDDLDTMPLVRFCKNRELRSTLRSLTSELEGLQEAHDRGDAERYVVEFLASRLASGVPKSLLGKLPIRVSVRLKGDTLHYTVGSSCGFEVELGGYPVGRSA